MADKQVEAVRNSKNRHRPGTRAFLDEARHMPGFSRFDMIHGYVYARWPYLYIGMALGEHPLAKGYIWLRERFAPLGKALGKLLPVREREAEPVRTTADVYHGKVMPVEKAKQLVMVKEPIELRDLEHVIPFDTARDIIFRNPDHIVVLDCPCRSSRENPCLPLDVCLVIGEPFASFVIEHHPERSRWISPQEAADILQAEHDRGHVHNAFFKDAMLGRFYAICNCCSCCCGAMQAMRHGTPMLISSGFVSAVDEKLCIGCEACMEICPFGALEMHEEIVRVDRALCMGCGLCVSACDQEALALVRDASKPEPLLLDELMQQAGQSSD
ncbi:MAG TPA: 4Fe-4S binding protein [Anaerolineae bacterium]|nr:4Fe-4S binding protein [Anaerolineae bacterium]